MTKFSKLFIYYLKKSTLLVTFALVFFLTLFYSDSDKTLSEYKTNKTFQSSPENLDSQVFTAFTKFKEPLKPRDPRAIRLEKYLKLQGSPLAKQADLIVELADDYDVDYKLIVAISGLESGYCDQTFANNNCWGFGGYSWPNMETAVREYYRLMNKGYFAKGRDTVEEIAPIYNNYPDQFIQRYYIHYNRID